MYDRNWYEPSGAIPVCFDAASVQAKLDSARNTLTEYKASVEAMKARIAYVNSLEMGNAYVIGNSKSMGEKFYSVSVYSYPVNAPGFRWDDTGRPVIDTPEGAIEAVLKSGNYQHFTDYASAREWAKMLKEKYGGIIVRQKPIKPVKK